MQDSMDLECLTKHITTVELRAGDNLLRLNYKKHADGYLNL